MNTVQSLFPNKIPHGLQETDPQGYTKHYYAESERITTQLGKYRFAVVDSCVAGDSLASVKLQAAANVFPTDSFPTPTPQLGYLHSLANHPNTTSSLYFYHSDHLGSSSWITDIYGRTIQHLYYLPWGEDFVDQRTGSFNSMYTFSAKEKDAETGYSYFGSRYYSSDMSIWLSVDPMAAKYPSLSPYTYCADNPVKLVDPNGDTLLPSAAFQASPYYMVYQNLNQTNSVYKRSVNQYQGANNNLYFDYKTEATEKAGHTYWIHRAKGTDITVTAKTTYYRPFGEDQTEIAMAKTLLHEAVHAENGLSKRRTPFHEGFDQASVLAGLIEYNSTYNLGYSNEDLEILSGSGLQESIEYCDYIERRALKNNRTFDEEKRFVDIRIVDIIVGNDLEK